MLCKNPVVQEKVAQEVIEVARAKANETNVDDFIANITEATLEQMHYLHAALTETLRLCPAVPVDGRSADADDILPDDLKVRRGDDVYYMAYMLWFQGPSRKVQLWFHYWNVTYSIVAFVKDLLMRSTLDSICEFGFGVDLNCLEGSSEEGVAFMKAFDESNALIYWRLNDNEDILSRFLIESEKDPEQMNDKYLRDIVLNFAIAGKDISANTLSWFLYMMCKNPIVQEKVAKEVRDVVGAKSHETKSTVSLQISQKQILSKCTISMQH
ncbi:hypothetical protein TIFTF001_012236 [Ficus carica]|uniref:Cytochrome P450 n=1 Tax=Ficus carica TaxID=3494 RepID=A0AA88AFK7_FICCA|nr:hypothetical protein TIFTF001_012236 [Ficus carica]